MKTYLEFGMNGATLGEAKAAVETALGVHMDPHDSSYRCGEYFRAGSSGDENFILQNNFDKLEQAWTKKEHPEYPFLLYVSETSRASFILRAMSGHAQLLSHKEL